RTYAKIVGVIQLPETAFASKEHAKSILILQKNGDSESVYQQPLLVKLPSLSNAEAMEDIFGQMNAWFEENFNYLNFYFIDGNLMYSILAFNFLSFSFNC